MERFLLSIAIVIGSMVAAHADTELVVLGPAAEDRVRQQTIDEAKQALARTSIPIGAAGIGPSCAADVTCLANTGAQVTARRVVAVSLDEVGGRITVQLALVDVQARELIGQRTATPKKLAELTALVTKLVEDAPVERAKTLMAKGNEHYNLGEFDAALVAYRRAYQVKPLAEFLFNLAQCHRKLGQHKEAIAMYQSYLVGVPNAENRAIVEDLIGESKSALADAERRETLTVEQKRAEELRLAREAEARAEAERRRAIEAKSKRSILPWVAVSVGAAAILGGGVLYLTSETDDGMEPTYRDSRPAGIGVAIGGAVLAGAGILWMTRF